MKKIILILFSILPLISFAQTTAISTKNNNPFELPVDSTTGKITFIKIIEVNNKNKSEIYTIIKSWITENYKSPKDVINIDDKESGIILLKSFHQNIQTISNSNITLKTNYHYSLKFNMKDLKYKNNNFRS